MGITKGLFGVLPGGGEVYCYTLEIYALSLHDALPI